MTCTDCQKNADRIREYENAITWHTDCLSCAKMLDSMYKETVRAEEAENALDGVRLLLDEATFATGLGRRIRERIENAPTGALLVDLKNARDSYDRLNARIAKVYSLHTEYYFAGDPTPYCAHCNQLTSGWIPFPCPTIRALENP